MKIIKIGAIWCPGCLVMNRIWNKILKENELDITELDYDMDNEEVNKYNIGKVLPVVLFMNDEGVELDRLVGEQKESKLIEVINSYRGL